MTDFKLRVKAGIVNVGQPGQFYLLCNAKSGDVLHAPNHWKTISGARNWAIKHGYDFVDQ